MELRGGGQRCDGCGRVNPASAAKRFKPFMIPPSVNAGTGLPDGRFDGIARAGNPKELALLHSCPGCKPKIERCASTYDFALLPDGPLRQIMTQVVTGERLRNLRLES